jgi:hypothetical protein
MCVRACTCVSACEYPGAWVCACAYVHIALLIQHATRMRHIVTSFVASLSPLYFSTLSQKSGYSGKRLLSIKRVFSFFLQLLSKTFLILRRSSCKVPVIFAGFLFKLNFLDRFWKTSQISTFVKTFQWEQSYSMRTDGRTDGHDEANSRFSQLFERVQNYLLYSLNTVV